MPLQAMRVLVRGRVQGVGFRFFVLQEARRLGLRGSAHNLADGRVEVVAVGAAADLDQLAERLAVGPPAARVAAVERTGLDPVPHFETFEVDG